MYKIIGVGACGLSPFALGLQTQRGGVENESPSLISWLQQRHDEFKQNYQVDEKYAGMMEQDVTFPNFFKAFYRFVDTMRTERVTMQDEFGMMVHRKELPFYDEFMKLAQRERPKLTAAGRDTTVGKGPYVGIATNVHLHLEDIEVMKYIARDLDTFFFDASQEGKKAEKNKISQKQGEEDEIVLMDRRQAKYLQGRLHAIMNTIVSHYSSKSEAAVWNPLVKPLEKMDDFFKQDTEHNMYCIRKHVFSAEKYASFDAQEEHRDQMEYWYEKGKESCPSYEEIKNQWYKHADVANYRKMETPDRFLAYMGGQNVYMPFHIFMMDV